MFDHSGIDARKEKHDLLISVSLFRLSLFQPLSCPELFFLSPLPL